MAVFVETAWAGMKGLETVIDDEAVKITGKSASYWAASEGKTRSWGKLVRGFSTRLIGLGGFAVVAASLEIWDIVNDYYQTDIALDKNYLFAKGFAAFGMLVIGGTQAVAGISALAGYNFLIPFVMNPWFAAGAVIIGLVYLFTTLALNYLKRDVIGHWLHKCRWSNYPEERFQDESVENDLFLEIQLSPAFFVKPTLVTKYVNVGHTASVLRKVPNGAWVQLRIPAALRGEIIQVNLIASRRPGLMMPVQLLGGSLKDYFIGYGVTESVAGWEITSDQKPDMLYNDPPYRPIPSEGEDVVWQTWVPVPDNAQYLELQVWYPPTIITVRNGDKGYRFQIELDAEGASESNGHILGANNNVLLIEKLGGRNETANLPIVG